MKLQVKYRELGKVGLEHMPFSLLKVSFSPNTLRNLLKFKISGLDLDV